MAEAPPTVSEMMRRALSPDSEASDDRSEAGRREGSLRGLGAMVRLANVRYAAPAERVPSDESSLPDDETIVRRATLLADAIERLDNLGLPREDAASRAGLAPEDLDLLLRGDLVRFDEATLSIVLGRLDGEAESNAGREGDDA